SRIKVDTTSLEGIAVAVERTKTVRAQKALLQGEGRVGTYEQLKDQNPRGASLAAHHMPSKQYMETRGVSKPAGIAMNTEHPNPGVGGRHREIHKEFRTIPPETAPRDALARSVMRARKVYMEDGVYTPDIRDSLLDVIKQNGIKFPDLFKK
ncbi:MAG: hypothetical protein LBT03_01555, partial [Holosporales bacterium]|nr:hypothetical protein [Holosporales bacterium]